MTTNCKSNIDKDDFLKIISDLSPKQINELIKKNGLPPRRINPIIIRPIN